MTASQWLTDLEALAARYGAGIPADLGAMAMADLWGLYRFLRALAERAS